MLKRPMLAFFLVLLLTFSGLPQDAATALADKLEQAPAAERTAIITAEGQSETLRASFRILLARSYTAYQAVELDKAIRMNRFLLEVADLFKEPRMQGPAYQMIGQSLIAQNKYEEAMEALDLAIVTAVETHDKRLEAIIWSLKGQSLRVIGRSEESRTAGENAVRLFRENGNLAESGQALNQLGITVRSMGLWQQAVDYFTESLKLSESLNLASQADASREYIADVYNTQHDYSLALSYMERVTRPSGTGAGTQRRLASIDSRLGNIYLRMKRPEAREVLERALAESRNGNDISSEAWVLQRLAELDENQLPQIALERYRSAAEVYAKLNNPGQESSARGFMARLYNTLKQPALAAETARAAVAAGRRSGSPNLLSGALDELGRALRDLGNTREAAVSFEESVRLTEQQRSEITGGGTNGANFLRERTSPYTALMDLRAQEGNNLHAIQLSEQVRARWLLDALAAGGVDPDSELTTADKQKEQILAREAARWNEELSRPSPSTDAKSKFEKAARDLDSYRTELFMAHSHLKTTRGKIEPITKEDLLFLVPDTKTVLIEYAFWEKGTWAFTLTRNAEGGLEVKSTKLATKEKNLDKQVEEFRQALATRDLSYATLSKALYRELLTPLATQLHGKTSIGIIPDGTLWNLPFHALISSTTGKYLIEDAAVFYSPSLTTLRQSLSSTTTARNDLKPILALAAGTPDLPNTTAEAHQLAALYGSQSLTVSGTEASEELWKREAGNYRILHLATHGVLNSGNPLFSYLQLSKGGSDDGMLEAREILTQTLHAEIAVLSACETGRGEVIGGEGLLGMSWAMLTAGTPTVVVSQWKVDSDATTQLMVAFHRSVAAAVTAGGAIRGKAQALRTAELQLIRTKNFRHPFYWAAFQMLGDGS